MSTPKKQITMGEAALPLRLLTNLEGFVTVTDAEGYYVFSLSPLQVKALVEAITKASEPPPWLGQPIPKGPS